MRFLALALLIGASLPAVAQSPLIKDPSFGRGGDAVYDVLATTFGPAAEAATLDRAGRTLFLYTNASTTVLVRVLPDGTVDPAFGSTGASASVRFGAITPLGPVAPEITGVLPRDVLALPSGGYMVVGLLRVGTPYVPGVVVLDASGAIQAARTYPEVATATQKPVADVDEAGRVFLAGSRGGACWVLGLDADGTIRSEFGTRGGVVGPTEEACAVGDVRAAGGKIVAAGSIRRAGDTDAFVARLDASTGAYDEAFGEAGIVTRDLGGEDQQLYGLVVEPDGSVAASGSSTTPGGVGVLALRLKPDGSPAAFGTDGLAFLDIGAPLGNPPFPTPYGIDIALVDGLPVVIPSTGGRLQTGSGRTVPSGGRAIRFGADGALDPTFGDGGVADLSVPGSEVSKLAELFFDADGRLVVYGWQAASLVRGFPYPFLSRYRIDPTPTASDAVRASSVSISDLGAFPNPTRSASRVSFRTAYAEAAHVRVVDVLGREVASAETPAGTSHTASFPGLAPGTYTALVTVRDGGASTRLTVVR